MSITTRSTVSRVLSLVVLTVFSALAIATLSAQGPGRGGRGMPPGRGPGAGPGGLLPGLERLDLTEAQREQVRALVAEQTNQGVNRTTLDTLQQQLTTAVMAEAPDLSQIEQIKASIAEADAAALTRRIELQLKVAQILTPEQRQKARERAAGPPRGGPRGRGAL